MRYLVEIKGVTTIVRLVDNGRALVPWREDTGRFVSAKRCELIREADLSDTWQSVRDDEEILIAIVTHEDEVAEDMYRMDVENSRRYLLALAGC